MVRLGLSTLIFSLAGIPVLAEPQRYQPVLTDDPAETWFVLKARNEGDVSKKLELLNLYQKEYPNGKSLPWVLSELYECFIELKQPEKALEVGERLLALDPTDLALVHRNLKIAEDANNPDLIRRWADRTTELARLVLSASPPLGTDATGWRAKVELARQLVAYTDYLAYIEVFKLTDLRQKIRWLEEFPSRHPDSSYLPRVLELHFQALRSIGDQRSALPLAERLIKADPSNEDALLFVAETLFQQDTDPERVMVLCSRLIDLMADKPKPEAVTDAGWSRKKARYAGRAHWMMGKIQVDRAHWAQGDRSLRAALASLRGVDNLTAAILLHLGWTNYKLGNLQDARKFNEQCLAYKSPFQELAAKNLVAIQREQPGK